MAGQGNKTKKSHLSGKTSEPAFIKKLDIASNKSATDASIVGGTVRLQYWESILQDSIRASVVFTDTGNTLPKKKRNLVVVVEERLVLLKDCQLLVKSK